MMTILLWNPLVFIRGNSALYVLYLPRRLNHLNTELCLVTFKKREIEKNGLVFFINKEGTYTNQYFPGTNVNSEI